MHCWLCGEPGNLPCTNCGVSSCSLDHLHLHRSNTPPHCRPFVVRHDPRVGRYLVATRNLKVGEAVLRELPLVVGPGRGDTLVCVECLLPLQWPERDNTQSFGCPLCPLPLCSSSCAEGPWHKIECPLYRGLTLGQEEVVQHLQLLTALRLQLLRKKGIRPQVELAEGGDVTDRCLDQHLLQTVLSALDRTGDMEGVSKAYRQLFINSKALLEGGCRGSGLFPLYSLLNHSCLANTLTSLDQELQLQVTVVSAIQKGEEISTRYGGLNLGQPRRAQLLSDHWGFHCLCRRCLDPSDLGTFCSGLVCPRTHCTGTLLPYRTLSWRCEDCQYQVPLDFVQKTLRDAEILIRNNIGGEVESASLEAAVWSLGSSLHPHHFLLTQVKLVLLTQYSLVSSPTHPVLERIVQLGQELAWLAATLDSSLSPSLPRILKVLIPAWSRLTDCHGSTGNLSQQQVASRKQKCYRYVDQLVSSSRLCKSQPAPA